MGGFWPFTLTPEVFTGNPATVNDAYNTALPNNGARMPLGTPVYQTLGPNTTPSSPVGARVKYRYVRLNCTTPPTFIAGGPLFWKDNTFTIVTAVAAEAPAGVNGVAGILVNNNPTNGNYILMQTNGYNAAVQAAAGTVGGDAIIPGSAASMTTYRVASGTAPSQATLAIAVGNAVASGSIAAVIVVEDAAGL